MVCVSFCPVWTKLSALLDDLEQRGLLGDTLVAMLGEFGRSPTITKQGRDHWPHCYSSMLAGGGVRGGTVYGASDQQGAYVKDRPVSPEDFGATLLSALGVPLDTKSEPRRLHEPRQHWPSPDRPLRLARPSVCRFGAGPWWHWLLRSAKGGIYDPGDRHSLSTGVYCRCAAPVGEAGAVGRLRNGDQVETHGHQSFVEERQVPKCDLGVGTGECKPAARSIEGEIFHRASPGGEGKPGLERPGVTQDDPPVAAARGQESPVRAQYERKISSACR